MVGKLNDSFFTSPNGWLQFAAPALWCQSRFVPGVEADEAAVGTDEDDRDWAEGERTPEIGEDLPVAVAVFTKP